MGKFRIVSKSAEAFADREQSGRLLAEELSEFRGKNAVVLGIPRGGIAVAARIAAMLDAELDVVLSRKLRSPLNPELAIGAVTEEGKLFLNGALAEAGGPLDGYIEDEKARQMEEVSRRARLYRKVRPKVPLGGRLVIVTDDGAATGITMKSSLWAVRRENPAKLVLALPVGPAETVEMLAEYADETICLRAPAVFWAVGQFYREFLQVSDEAALEILMETISEKERKLTGPRVRGEHEIDKHGVRE